MYHSDTEILFPMRVAPGLRDLRGRKWRRLVELYQRAESDIELYLAELERGASGVPQAILREVGEA